MTKNQYVKLFKQEVADRSKKIDKDNEENWFSLTLGWAIAKGMGPVKAYNFAVYIRYKTDLG